MNVADEISKLHKLKEEGALTEEEFQKAKAALLAKNESAGAKIRDTVDQVAADVNMWGMFIHLSQFAGVMIPYAGLVLPIVLWQIKKNDSTTIDKHGKIVANWIISGTIYGLGIFVLTFLTLGLGGILFIPLLIIAVAFPIIGAVKANNGEIWPYPLTIEFFKLDEPAAPPMTPPSGSGQNSTTEDNKPA